MQVISRAGIAWLEQHKLLLSDMIHEARIRRYITRRRVDLDPDHLTVYGSDWFEFKKDGWRLEHRSGLYGYKERANGLAILNVDGVQLPDTTCSRLSGSLERLEALIEIDPASVVGKSQGRITSVANNANGSLEIRLRLEWVDTFVCMML